MHDFDHKYREMCSLLKLKCVVCGVGVGWGERVVTKHLLPLTCTPGKRRQWRALQLLLVEFTRNRIQLISHIASPVVFVGMIASEGIINTIFISALLEPLASKKVVQKVSDPKSFSY